jgi:putative transposase
VKYAFIQAHDHEFRVRRMCRVLEVSPSGYYGWVARRAAHMRRATMRRGRAEMIRACFERHRGRYGAPRLTAEIRDQVGPIARKTVAKCMSQQGLRARAARRFKATTNSKHSLPVAPNRLKQDFSATARDQKWVADITYLWTDEGWLYLAVVIDVYSRSVIGWSMSSLMTAELACDALTMALGQRRFPRGVIVHTDRGSQYCSKAYQALLGEHGLVCSMSGKGNCYDNAMAESFFHSLKVEAIHGERITTREQMRAVVFEYIEIEYNRVRRHSALGYLSPFQFENQQLA